MINTFKKVLIILFLILSNTSFAQNLFNKDLELMDFISKAAIVFEERGIIYVLGHGTNNNPFSNNSVFVSRLDENGNLINTQILIEKPSTFSFTNNVNDIYKIDTSYIFFISTPPLGELLEVSEDFEVISTTKIINSIDTSGYQFSTDLYRLNDSIFVIATSISDDINTDSDIQLAFVNILSKQVEYLTFGFSSFDDTPYSITEKEGKLYIGARTFETISHEKFKYRSCLFKMYENHNIQLRYISSADSIRNQIEGMIIEEDGGIICINAKGIEVKISPYFEWYRYFWSPRIFKLDSNYNKIWETEVGVFNKYYLNNTVSDLVRSINGDGYIVTGEVSPYNYTDYDSLGQIISYIQQAGYISKVSLSGENLWNRVYRVVDTDTINYFHNIYDIEVLDDGYLIGGSINYDGTAETGPNYHSWVLKVDEYGCLIPGCQEDTTSVSNIGLSEMNLLIYPNPVVDKLLIQSFIPEKVFYKIYDMNGILIDEFESLFQNETTIIPVSNYPKGSYLLQAMTKTGISEVKKFVLK